MTFQRTDIDLILEVLSDSKLSDTDFERLRSLIIEMDRDSKLFKMLWNQLTEKSA